MQRVLLYEFVTSGGLLGGRDTPAGEPIRREGAAMMAALTADFAALAEVETLVMVDFRATVALPACRSLRVHTADEEFTILSERSRQVDWTLIVAPEFDDLLRSRCRLIEESGGRLLGPSSALVALAADKQRSAEQLSSAGVPVPHGVAIDVGEELPTGFAFPAVLKPRFGAGSENVRLISDAAAAECLQGLKSPARLEEFCAGTAGSVAFLCGPAGRFALPACRQRLSDDGRFRYLGGTTPLEPELALRAAALAGRAIATLPRPFGYLGVDLILGEAPNGRDDVVVEINPRLTTSYVGLRALALDNLAAAMLDVATGNAPRLSFDSRKLEFDADGTIRAL